MTNIFETASRKKLTFVTSRGLLSVEQLWDLPLKTGTLSLNSIAVDLKKKIAQTEDMIDLVDGDGSDTVTSSKVADDKLRLDIVMHIIKVLKAERDARQAKEAQASTLRVLDEALAAKRQEQLLSGSIEDLEKRRQAIIDGTKPTL